MPRGQEGEYYRLALDLHADMMLHARLPEEEIGPPFDPDHPQVAVKRERMVVLEEIKMNRDRPWRRAMQQLAELLYPPHPYRREVLGSERGDCHASRRRRSAPIITPGISRPIW